MKTISSEEKLQSFIIDPFLLVAVGFLVGYFLIKPLRRKFPKIAKWTPILYLVILLIFWLISVGLYLNYFDMPFLGEYGQGNHFMWNSGVEIFGLKPIVDLSGPSYANPTGTMNILAIIFFLTYPVFLYLGIKIGRKD